MSASVARTHTRIPRVSAHVIGRPRLNAALETSIPLTLLRGASGAGKTTALVGWAFTTRSRVAWLTATPAMQGSHGLATAVLRALRPHAPAGTAPPHTPAGAAPAHAPAGTTGIEDAAPASDATADGAAPGHPAHAHPAPEPDPHPLPEADSALEPLASAHLWADISDLLHSTEEPLALVLDDASVLDREAVFDLCRTVAAAPLARLLVATNRPSAFDSAGLDLVIDTAIITPEDLMFDLDEIRRALDVDEEGAAAVQRASGGFPAVVRAVSLRDVGQDGAALTDAASAAIEDFLQTRIEAGAFDERMLRGLIRLSITDTVDHALAIALTGDEGIAEALDQAEAFGFGRWSPGGRRTFTMAPLARTLLLRELRRSRRAEIPQLRRVAVEGALRRGAPFEGLRLAVEQDDLALASHVIMSGWSHLLDHHGRAVVALLGDLPLSRLKHEPLVAMLLGICLNANRLRRLRGLQLLRLAVSAANARRTTLSPAERLFIWTAESAALRVIGMPDRAGQVAARALALYTETPEAKWQRYATEMPLLCTHLGLSLYYGGRKEQAVQLFDEAAALAAVHGSGNAFHAISLLSGIRALDGDLPEARHLAELIRQGDWDPALLDGYRGTFYRVAEALLAVEAGDTSAAARHVRAFEPHRATSEHWTTMAAVEAWVALHAGEAAAGLERLESFARLRGREAASAHARHALSRARVLLHLALGDVSAARHVLQRDATTDRFSTLLERARLALVDGRAPEAARLLAQSRLRPGTARERAEAAAVQSAALHRASPAAAQRVSDALSAQLADRELSTPLALLAAEDFATVRADLAPSSRVAYPRSAALPSFATRPRLSSREQVVLHALASGAPLPAIAAELRVSPNTLKAQLRSIYRKLEVGSRAEALEQAARHGLLSP
ncbi:LuxR C-terminal-related transcriptional regulator [Microbacterium sp. p3-SID336]|uniref:LuxR C-terminal-related transcriptional regulator n=1 Tax=Microbacterium sp. p3-SID336 TaxID=2916212 RepID=UPI0021A6957B|nr:LuxR C-terminal-related transcriptional regulator [Microbacterium sp. p3-SID336]MCT1477153.1 LuxR C-terminal-related transcriptional regulator [Microbacterium sp. p3-SID336]